jgi:pimeloyl-ACP methyl ester carboxylesterase
VPRSLIVGLLGFAAVYVGICLLLYLLQRSMIYFPQPRSGPPGSLLTAEVEGRKVLATARARAGPEAVLYFGGNAEDVSGSVEGLAAAFPEHALYLLHYPGYGGAPGRPSEAAIMADALALFDRLVAAHPRITVIGRSLGSGPAVQVAGARPVARLVLVSPYDSLLDIATRQYPWVPVRWLLLDTFDSARHAPKVSAPTLVIAAERDEVIPRASTELLLRRFPPGVASLGLVPGAAHNFSDRDPHYLRLLRDGR